jgi:hypothetical protein
MQLERAFMTWQTVGLLKAVLCVAAISMAVIACLLHRLHCGSYNKQLRIAFLILGALGVGAYFNFGRFLGGGITDSILWYDFYHYYMGAKYFPELHYDGLYRATVVADDEDARMFRGVKGFGWVRDLMADRLVPVRDVLARKQEVRAQFQPARWNQFKTDLRFFQAHIPAGTWPGMLTDFGFNGTPVWVLGGAVLSGLCHTAQYWQAVALVWLDVLLMAVAFAFVYRAFGLTASGLALLFVGVNYAHRYEFISGSLLRWDWLAYLLIGVSLVKIRRYRSAGFFLAYSSLLRVFPLAYVGGVDGEVDQGARRTGGFIASEGVAIAQACYPAATLGVGGLFKMFYDTIRPGGSLWYPQGGWCSGLKGIQRVRSVNPVSR